MTVEQRNEVLSHIQITDSLQDLAQCDLVIESIIEELAPKQALFKELDAIVKADAILATNTSTLAVVKMAQATNRQTKYVASTFSIRSCHATRRSYSPSHCKRLNH